MRVLLAVCLAQLSFSCAKQTTPTGGPKDEGAPQLIRSVPANRQTNFKGDQIELVFDEYVQVNNAREQIVIVPTVGKKFEAIARKNKVTIKLNSTLLDTTTYTINFRESIQDLTEKNPAKNLKLAFSTGPHIDSLFIKGTVKDLLKGVPAENFTVAIAPLNDTFNIFNHTAQFFTLTDKEGEFAIENIKRGNYRLYAFEDKNKNLKVDSRSESFAFVSDTLSLTQSINSQVLYAIRLDMRPIRLISAKPIANHFLVRLNKGYSTSTIQSVLKEYKVQYDIPEFSSLRFYNTLTGLDSLPVRLVLTDSLLNTLDTTLYISFNKTSLQKDRFELKPQNMSYVENKQLVKGELVFTKPVAHLVYDSIYIRADSLTTVKFTSEDFTWDATNTIAKINKPLTKALDLTAIKVSRNNPNQQSPRLPGQDTRRATSGAKPAIKPTASKPYNQLIIAKGAFISVEGDTVGHTSQPFSVTKPENTATLLVEAVGAGNIIVQLLNADYKVVTESTLKKPRFDNLLPGEYQIRVVLDKNDNGKWDPGNYHLNIEPEMITFYTDDTGSKKLNLKANWELGPLLIRY
ncbi:MAG: Ig-like domain-containing protein [Flammeovirgaceae bacterium]|nr:MAG: Ig-like domain-containing protein [Flammeovirgaceae bacterium]